MSTSWEKLRERFRTNRHTICHIWLCDRCHVSSLKRAGKVSRRTSAVFVAFLCRIQICWRRRSRKINNECFRIRNFFVAKNEMSSKGNQEGFFGLYFAPLPNLEGLTAVKATIQTQNHDKINAIQPLCSR